MGEIVVIPVTDTLHLQHIDDESSFSADIESRVRELWIDEQAESVAPLHNGKVLSFVGVHGNTLICKTVEYREYIACRRDPEIRSSLAIIPIALTGLTISGSHILLGKRSNVTAHTGYWEFAPAGSLDAGVDFREQYLMELGEETGIARNQVIAITPFAVLQDVDEHIVEICSVVRTEVELESIPRSTSEYSSLVWLDKDGCRAFLRDRSASVVPVSAEAFTFAQSEHLL